MYAGKLAEKASTGDDHRRAPAPVHADAHLVAARGRRSLRGQEADRHPRQPALAAESADGLPLPGALSAGLRQVREEPPFVKSSATTRSPAGRPPGQMLSLDRVSKVYRVGHLRRQGAARGRERQLRRRGRRGRLADRRERQRQDDRRQDDPEAHRHQPRHDHLRRRRRLAVNGSAVKDVLPPGPGRLPGPVQLLQPDLQGRPGLRHDPERVLPERAHLGVERQGRGLAARRHASIPARCSTSTRTSSAAVSSSACWWPARCCSTSSSSSPTRSSACSTRRPASTS